MPDIIIIIYDSYNIPEKLSITSVNKLLSNTCQYISNNTKKYISRNTKKYISSAIAPHIINLLDISISGLLYDQNV